MSKNKQADLEERSIEVGTPEYEDFIELYESAFPLEEQVEPALLLEGATSPACSFTAYYDGDTFCGFSYVWSFESNVYLLFLATNNTIRSRGYGSRILARIMNKATDKPVWLDIEPVSKDAPNYEQRLRRLRFYERAGFSQTGYALVEEDGLTFSLLCSKEPAPIKTFMQESAPFFTSYGNTAFIRA